MSQLDEINSHGENLHNAISSKSSRPVKAEKGPRAICHEESSITVHGVTASQSSFFQG